MIKTRDAAIKKIAFFDQFRFDKTCAETNEQIILAIWQQFCHIILTENFSE